MQVADERAKRLAVMPLDGVGDALHESGISTPSSSRMTTASGSGLVAVSVSTAIFSDVNGAGR